jgi:glycosyltransferase involved in cell wall biosynthesis
MNPPLVSIVLPVYNGSRYLDESVHSCRDQTYSNWELIIVDDASTDDTASRIASYIQADPRIRTIRHAKNKKLPAALNTGFREARGDYLTWTSDDNLYRPHALTEMVAFLNAHSDVGLVYAQSAIIDGSGAEVESAQASPPEMLAWGNAVGACFLFRHTVWEEVGEYAEDLFLAEDYDYWLRTSAVARLELLNKDLYLYRDHPASLTNQRQRAVYLACGCALERNLPKLHWMDNRALALAHLRLAVSARVQQTAQMPWRQLSLCLRTSPRIILQERNPFWFTYALLGPQLTKVLLRVCHLDPHGLERWGLA